MGIQQSFWVIALYLALLYTPFVPAICIYGLYSWSFNAAEVSIYGYLFVFWLFTVPGEWCVFVFPRFISGARRTKYMKIQSTKKKEEYRV